MLYEKINLFERVIGELDTILQSLNIDNLETEIKEIFAESASPGEARIKMENLTAVFQQHIDEQGVTEDGTASNS